MRYHETNLPPLDWPTILFLSLGIVVSVGIVIWAHYELTGGGINDEDLVKSRQEVQEIDQCNCPLRRVSSDLDESVHSNRDFVVDTKGTSSGVEDLKKEPHFKTDSMQSTGTEYLEMLPIVRTSVQGRNSVPHQRTIVGLPHPTKNKILPRSYRMHEQLGDRYDRSDVNQGEHLLTTFPQEEFSNKSFIDSATHKPNY